MDMTNSIIPKSDQINGDDLMTGARTVTIEKVSAGSAEQPVDVFLVEFPGRAFRPSKSMRRVLVAAYGADTSAYTGKRMTLYREPSIRFGANEVGGIRISHMSGIDKPLKIALTVTRGKKEPFTVEPLANVSDVSPTRASLHAAGANFGAGVGDVSSEKQMKNIGYLMGKLGMNEASMQLRYVADVIEREVSDANSLTMYEATRVITFLEKDIAQKELETEASADGIET